METDFNRSKELINSKICQEKQFLKEFKDLEKLYKEFNMSAKSTEKAKVFNKKSRFSERKFEPI